MNNGLSAQDYVKVEQAAADLEKEAQQMEQLFSEIKTEINKIGTDGDGTWRGDAADQVKAKFLAWSNTFASFVETMRSCSTHVRNTAANYRRADQLINQNITIN